jgi:hypothetical protein
MYSQS